MDITRGQLASIMRFCQLDSISEIIPGKSIVATKIVTGNEDYLVDHFPRFAVLPGVLMLEALYQASMFLVRATDESDLGLVFLKTAKNIKFADFLKPNDKMKVAAQIVKVDGNRYSLKATGHKLDENGEETSLAVSGRLVLEVSDGEQPEIVNKHAKLYMQELREQLCPPSA